MITVIFYPTLIFGVVQYLKKVSIFAAAQRGGSDAKLGDKFNKWLDSKVIALIKILLKGMVLCF